VNTNLPLGTPQAKEEERADQGFLPMLQFNSLSRNQGSDLLCNPRAAQFPNHAVVDEVHK
jgi:hypothetical protein